MTGFKIIITTPSFVKIQCPECKETRIRYANMTKIEKVRFDKALKRHISTRCPVKQKEKLRKEKTPVGTLMWDVIS